MNHQAGDEVQFWFEKVLAYLRTLGASSIEKATVDAASCSLESARRGEECEACQ